MALVFVLTASQMVPCCADLRGTQVLRPGAEDLFSVTGTDEADSAQDDLDSSQKNAIAMLNYIAVLTQEINSSRNSRLHMEDAYSGLVNNMNPNAVDNRTLEKVNSLLDLMEKYGSDGYVVLDMTMSCIYRNGYYLEMPIKRLALYIYRYIAGTTSKTSDDVAEIIMYCGEIGLFDSGLLGLALLGMSVGIEVSSGHSVGVQSPQRNVFLFQGAVCGLFALVSAHTVHLT